MFQPDPSALPAPAATGLLSDKPLAHLLVFAHEKKLSGTFELADDPHQYALVVVDEGRIARVWTSEPIVYLGQTLFEAQVLTEAQVKASLVEMTSRKVLHGQVLLSSGLITPEQLASALYQQRLRKLHHAFSFSPTSRFSFYADADLIGERPGDAEPSDPLLSIWRGVATYPSAEHVSAAIAAVGPRQMRLTGTLDPRTFRDGEREIVESLRHSPASVAEIAARAGVEVRIAEVLVYFLTITKLGQVVDAVPAPSRVPEAPASKPSVMPRVSEAPPRASSPPSPRTSAVPPAPPSAPGSTPGPLSSRPGSDGLLASRPFASPSVAPLSMRGGPPSTPAPRNPEADRAIEAAEMHFLVGERPQALNLVREALTLSPKMPDGLVLLAALEASNVHEGQEDKLRDIVKRIDPIIAHNPHCRKGRYYRAQLRKRLGDFDGAIDDLERALEDDPDDVDTRRELKICQLKVRDAPKSQKPTSLFPALFDRLRGR